VGAVSVGPVALLVHDRCLRLYRLSEETEKRAAEDRARKEAEGTFLLFCS
jgi:hypothetical protein